MDETACCMDMPSDTTVHFIGARSVSLKTSGHEKDHYTVVLTAKADGSKLKLFIVFKGKGTRLIKNLSSIPGLVVRFSANGWLNDSLTIEYLRTVVGSLSFAKRLMIWDTYHCHVSQAVKLECSRLKLQTATIPGGCTKFIQAADVVWNASFKSNISAHYDTWLSEPSCHEFTRNGNMKAPSRSVICDWVKNSWDSIPSDTVKNSFKSGVDRKEIKIKGNTLLVNKEKHGHVINSTFERISRLSNPSQYASQSSLKLNSKITALPDEGKNEIHSQGPSRSDEHSTLPEHVPCKDPDLFTPPLGTTNLGDNCLSGTSPKQMSHTDQ